MDEEHDIREEMRLRIVADSVCDECRDIVLSLLKLWQSQDSARKGLAETEAFQRQLDEQARQLEEDLKKLNRDD